VQKDVGSAVVLTDQVLVGMMASIDKTSSIIEHLTNIMLDATIEQKRGGETVVKATDSIADVARQNLQVVEGINLAVRQLAAEAETLRKRVEEFTV
jgi:methyl-accepting chemotaxis protein